MKKLLSLVLALVMLMACAAPALADEGSEPDWTEYDALVAEIKSTTDFVEREALLHKAEEMLMATYAVVPLYYYNDLYMQKSNVEGIYANLFQTKFFAYATKTGDNAGLWLMAAAASGLGLVWMTISGKKRKEENA